MKGILAILSGLGVGAFLMYLFDPQQGGRRRALIRDKAVRLNRQGQETLEGTMKDLSNRAQGLAHEIQSVMPEGSQTGDTTIPSGYSDGRTV